MLVVIVFDRVGGFPVHAVSKPLMRHQSWLIRARGRHSRPSYESNRRKKTGPQAGFFIPSNELLGGSSSVSSLVCRSLGSGSSVGCGRSSSSCVGCSSVSSSSSWSGCVSSWHGCVSRSDDSSWGFGHWCDWSFFFLSASSQGNSEQGSDQQGFFHGFFLSIYKSRTT